MKREGIYLLAILHVKASSDCGPTPVHAHHAVCSVCCRVSQKIFPNIFAICEPNHRDHRL